MLMKKYLVIGLIVFSLILVSCTTTQEPVEEKINFCEFDSDCVPMPGCHPRTCINKDYESDYDQPEACTMMFDQEAAYSPEDCACSGNTCINSNIQRLQMEDALEIALTCEGELTGDYMYNEITKTWWFDTSIEKPGCAPACVVDEQTRTVAINWRCTGLRT